MKTPPIQPQLLMTREEGTRWHEYKAALGPIYPGYDSFDPYMNWMKEQLADCGCVDFREHHWTHNSYRVKDWPQRRPDSMRLVIEGRELRVGTFVQLAAPTGPDGLTAEMVYYDVDRGEPADGAFEGKIVVMEECKMPSKPYPAKFLESYTITDTNYRSAPEPPAPILEYPDPAVSNSWFTRWCFFSWWDFQVPWAVKGRAAGLVILSQLPYGSLYGLYDRQKVRPCPCLVMDREMAGEVLPAAKAGKPATMYLDSEFFDADAWNFVCYLPGANYGTDRDEQISLNCHTDAMSLTQDNGSLGILGIVRYFSRLPQAQRPKTLLLCIDSRHFIEGFEWGNLEHDPYVVWPEIKKPITACLGLEHMGEMSARCDFEQNDMKPTGLPEFSFMVSDDNDYCAHLLIRAAIDSGLERADVKIDGRPGLHGLHKGWVRAVQAKVHDLGVCVLGEAGNWPGCHTQIYSTMQYFGAKKFADEVALWTQVVNGLMHTDHRVYHLAWANLNTAIRTAAGEGAITGTAKEGLLMGVASLFRDAEEGDFEVAARRLEGEIVPAARDLGAEPIAQAAQAVAAMLRG